VARARRLREDSDQSNGQLPAIGELDLTLEVPRPAGSYVQAITAAIRFRELY
jgi:hypothetical protein